MRGERALRQELRAKGVDRAVIDDVIAARDRESDAGSDVDARPDGADGAAARRLLARHARALDRVGDARQRRQRAYALLARNGFDSETATTAIAELLGHEVGSSPRRSS